MAAYGRSFGHAGALPHTCRVCRRAGAEELREEWGCDRETPDAQFLITCSRCDGIDPRCPVCKGTGEEECFRCPHALVEDWTTEYLLLHRSWPGCLLHPGGVGDQPAVYLEAMYMLDAAKGRLEKKAEEEARKRKPPPASPPGRRR